MLNIKVGIVSLGCPKNTVDSEIMLAQLKKNGYEISANKSEADVIIVNTCAFIESAVRESINTILEMAEYKKKKLKLLIVAGCLSERFKNNITEEMPEVDLVVGPGFYGDICLIIKELLEKKDFYPGKVLTGKAFNPDYLDNERLISTPAGYAYLKIAEGCSNRCTYCIIPKLRGPYKSRKPQNIINEANHLNNKGIKEIIIIAQDTTRYGEDIGFEPGLAGLLKSISGNVTAEWLRLLYCYPGKIINNLINIIAKNEKVCKYIDIPLQHISDRILRAMGRMGGSSTIKKMLESLSQNIPEITIRTTLITGFPGEDEKDFRLLYDFVKEYEFDRLGVFEYSPVEGTKAFSLPNRVPENIVKERYDILMRLQSSISLKKNKARIGKVYKTLVEGISDDGIFYYGRTQHEAPDIDGKIYFVSNNQLKPGRFVNVKILDCNKYDLTGVTYT